ncbi:hypothetical protein [Rhodanobacter sp. A1T4]|uniref:hypothetical protein n=1 Tax=Rhodanobacter sp. A1T4 TaxID=2723087 RepID=UPI0016186EAC|nr:hypothetical protein [Rhodanobacter sp. A1T4]MBB6249454.1 hypothetical protein [Rhodanobacter sp. A1T4]
MHPSHFLILGAQESNLKRELSLSREASEWLFSKHFWGGLNQKYQTIFSQYEEDTLDHNLTNIVAESLQLLISELDDEVEAEVRFRYGWNEKKESLYCVLSRKTLIEEISGLENLMVEASKLNSDVYCQL